MTGPQDKMADQDHPQDEAQEAQVEAAATDEKSDRKLSRVERLKQKVRKMQGKNPDIYPMW